MKWLMILHTVANGMNIATTNVHDDYAACVRAGQEATSVIQEYLDPGETTEFICIETVPGQVAFVMSGEDS